jgi:cell division protein FtsB
MAKPQPFRLTLPALRAPALMTFGAVMMVYMLISAAQALWQNYQLTRRLTTLREENAQLVMQNQYLQNLIAYRKTDSFKDREARSKLNYQKAGEMVLVIPEDDLERFATGNINGTGNASAQTHQPTNPEKWWNYIFAKS